MVENAVGEALIFLLWAQSFPLDCALERCTRIAIYGVF